MQVDSRDWVREIAIEPIRPFRVLLEKMPPYVIEGMVGTSGFEPLTSTVSR